MNETMKRKVQITETHTNKPNFGSIDGSASSVGRLKALHEAIDVELSGYDGNASTVVKKIRTTLQVIMWPLGFKKVTYYQPIAII